MSPQEGNVPTLSDSKPSTPFTTAEDGSAVDSRMTLGDWSIDEYKPMKVAVIGAGFSGILAGIRCVIFLDIIATSCELFSPQVSTIHTKRFRDRL